jgi:hypothetical protein
MLINKLQKQHSKILKIKELIELTTLPFLLALYESWGNKNIAVKQVLSDYLFDYCKIKTEENLININSQEYHYISASDLIQQLKEINSLYNDQYFTEDVSYSLSEAIYQKDCVLLVKEKNICYMKLLVGAYVAAYQNYYEELKYISPISYNYWTVWWEADQWIFADNVNEINQIKEAMVMSYYITSDFTHLNPIFTTTLQILFLQQNIITYSQEWKNRMLSHTSLSEVNFWYENCKVLKELEITKALLWQSINNYNKPEGLEEYKLEKITLY